MKILQTCDDILKWLESLYASLDVWWKNNLNLGVSWLKVKIWPVKMGIKHWQVGFQNWKMESWVREHQEVSIEQFNFMSLKSIHWAKCYCNHWKKIEKGIHKTRWDALFGNLAWQSEHAHVCPNTEEQHPRIEIFWPTRPKLRRSVSYWSEINNGQHGS